MRLNRPAAVGVEIRNAPGREMTGVELNEPWTGLDIRNQVETGLEGGG